MALEKIVILETHSPWFVFGFLFLGFGVFLFFLKLRSVLNEGGFLISPFKICNSWNQVISRHLWYVHPRPRAGLQKTLFWTHVHVCPQTSTPVICTKLQDISCIIPFLLLTHRKQCSVPIIGYPRLQAVLPKDRHQYNNKNGFCPLYVASALRPSSDASWSEGVLSWTAVPGVASARFQDTTMRPGPIPTGDT